MRKLKAVLAASLVAMVLVVSADYTATAATGHSFILGKLNKANKITALKRTTAGPALQLKTKSSSAPPMAVNGTGKVANLNADLVDGKDSSQLGVRTRVYRQPISLANVTQLNVDVPNVGPGTYLVGYGAWLYGTAGTYSYCWVQRNTLNTEITANSVNQVVTGGFQPFSGNGIIRMPSTGFVRLHCEYSANQPALTSYAGAPIEITLTKVDGPSGSALARTTAGGRQAADH